MKARGFIPLSRAARFISRAMGAPSRRSSLNDARFRERGEGAVLLDVAQTLHGNVHDDGLAELGDEDAAALEVRFAAYFPGRVELRGARLVRIAPAYLRAFAGHVTASCHSSAMLA